MIRGESNELSKFELKRSKEIGNEQILEMTSTIS